MKTELLPVADNITEVLVMILDFTRCRHKILISNLNNVNNADYTPMDLDVESFSDVMNQALTEHLRSGRLALADTDTVKFEDRGNFDATPVPDEQAGQLFETDIEQYLELQKKKLSENSLNSRLAADLLRRKQNNN